MAERTPWRQLPDADLATPVLALAADGDLLWLGGVGGLRCLDAAGPAPAGGGGPGIAPVLTSVAAICRSGRWLVAGGAEGIVRQRDDQYELADVQGSGAPVAALLAIRTVAGTERDDDTGVLLAGTLGDGVLRSLDRGRSWAPVSFGLDDHEVSALCVGPAGGVLAGTADGIYAATASVKAWRRCAGTQGVAVAAIAYADDLLAAVSESGQALTSRDGGRTWTPGGTVQGQVTAMVGLPGGTLIVGTTDAGLWRSLDAGLTWLQAAGSDAAAVADADGLPRAVFCLAPHAGAVYAGTAGGLVASTDAGATWRHVQAPPTHDLDRLLVVGGRPVVAGARSGVVRLRPGPDHAASTWSALADTPFPLTAVAAAPDDALIASGPAGLFRCTDGATDADPGWTTLVGGEDGHVGVLSFRPDGFGLAAPARHGNQLLRTTDNGVSWQTVPAPFGVLPLVTVQVTAEVVLAATRDPRTGAIQLWASTDEGASWSREVRAETPWPLVRSVADPPLVSLGRALCARDTDGRWTRWAELADGIRAVAGDSNGLAVLTPDAIWSVADGEVAGRLDDGIPTADVLDICLWQGRLHALLTGGRVWWRDVDGGLRPGDGQDEAGRAWPELLDHASSATA